MASSLAYRPEVRERMKNEFLNDENYNFEAVNRASKACGPLVQWAVAQVCGFGREKERAGVLVRVCERERACGGGGGGGGAHMPVRCMSLQRAKRSTTHTHKHYCTLAYVEHIKVCT